MRLPLGPLWCSMPRISSAVAVDIRWQSKLGAWLNIVRTLFICVAIYAGTVIFNHDASRLVLQPIQRMLKQVLASHGTRIRVAHGTSCRWSSGPLRVGMSCAVASHCRWQGVKLSCAAATLATW